MKALKDLKSGKLSVELLSVNTNVYNDFKCHFTNIKNIICDYEKWFNELLNEIYYSELK